MTTERMETTYMHRIVSIAAVMLGWIAIVEATFAVPVLWVDWTAADTTSASGTTGPVSVSFSGNINPAAQTSGGGTNFWAVNSSTYTSNPEVDNPPPDSDIIRLTGGPGTGTQTLTFSTPVVDPVMAILSMGQLGVAVQYDFDQPFDILNVGPGFFDAGGNGSLVELAGDILEGLEGHGLIQFSGTISTINWTVPTAEFWHGFTVGIPRVSQAPEPATLALMILGLAGFGFARKRKLNCICSPLRAEF